MYPATFPTYCHFWSVRDNGKCFSFNILVKIIGHVRFLICSYIIIHVIFSEVWDLERCQQPKWPSKFIKVFHNNYVNFKILITITAYLTACDLAKSFSINVTSNIISCVHFLTPVYYAILCEIRELQNFQTLEVTFMVTHFIGINDIR